MSGSASSGGAAAAAGGGSNPEADAKYQQYLRDVSWPLVSLYHSSTHHSLTLYDFLLCPIHLPLLLGVPFLPSISYTLWHRVCALLTRNQHATVMVA